MISRFRSALFAGAAFAVLGLAPQAFATDVTPIPIPGNPRCTDAQAACPMGTFPMGDISELLVDADGGGIFTDGTLSVDVDVDLVTNEMDWDDVSLGGSVSVAAVIVKAGKSANLFCHDPPATEDTDLTGPGPKAKNISHAIWCYPTILRTCPLEETPRLTICGALLPLGINYFFVEERGPSIAVGTPGICLCTTTIEECNPELPAGDTGACGTGDDFKGLDSISIATSGASTCDTVCKTIAGRRRCFELCF